MTWAAAAATAAAASPPACGLPGAVLQEDRRNLTLEGVSTEFGLKPLAWPSSRIVTHILAILAQEVLGIRTTVLSETAASLTALYAIAGCTGEAPKRACGSRFSRAHAGLELWDSGLSGDVELMRSALGPLMPEDLGSMGYDGLESAFIPVGPKMRALTTEGLSLDFYASFNKSWHSPAPYFNKYSDINVSGLLPCSETRFYKEDIPKYLAITGDVGGVEVVNGTTVAKCEGGASGFWWFSPACRSSPETCIPFITAGDGWLIDPMMQRASVYNMPLALAVGTWSSFVTLPRNLDMFFYWWTPDTEFIDLRPSKVQFPENDKSRWASGDYLTESAKVTLRKWAHPSLAAANSRLRDTVAHLQLASSQVESMLISWKAANSSKSEADVACDWLKANSLTWRQWIPSETKCSEGWGLIGTTGAFVMNRSAASTCKWCPPGRFSRQLTDIDGDTHVCIECAAGEHQPSPAQVGCLLCAPGTFSSTTGASVCRNCGLGRASAGVGRSSCDDCLPGSFQDVEGSTTCEACPAGSFQEGMRSTGCRQCQQGSFSGENATVCEACAAGTAAPRPGSEACTACSPGSFADKAGAWNCTACPIGEYTEDEGTTACRVCGAGAPLWTTMRRLVVQGSERWVSTDGAASEASCGCEIGARPDAEGRCVACDVEGIVCPGMGEVVVQPGFYSPPQLSVFRCKSELRCPGGPPGLTCAPGRTGTGCGKCTAGTTPKGTGCAPCSDGDVAPFAIAVAFAIIACILLYLLFETAGQSEHSHAALLAGISGGLLVGLLQQLSVLGVLNISYKEPLFTFLSIVRVFAFDVEEFMRLGCIGDFSSMAQFATKVCMIGGAMALLGLVHIGSVLLRHNGRFRERRPVLIAVLGTVAMVFYISVTLTILRPLQCNLNPNGKWNNHVYEDVICWSSGDEGSAHTAMLILSVFALSLPVSLLAGVAFLARRYPAALRNGDVDFLRSFGFLFFRFRPHAHWYIMIVMVRSLFVGVVPVIPQPTLQIFLFMLALQLTLEAAIHWKPWRVRSLNFMDTAFGTIVTMFLTLAAFVVEERDAEVLGWICIGMVLAGMALIPVILGHAACKRLGGVSKAYQFFLCHSKSDAGAFARWLKMELQTSVNRDVFLDADNLESLDRLLTVVATEVQTLVLLGTKSVFFRPWCIGEMTAASNHGVDSQVLALPGMYRPDQQMIAMFETLAPDIDHLLDIGLQRDGIRKALTTFSQKPSIMVPMSITSEGISELCGMLVSNVEVGSVLAEGSGKEDFQTVILADLDNFEANAAAHVLQRLLVPYTCHDPLEIPRVLSADQDISADTTKALIVCTAGCFSHSAFVTRVVQVSDRDMLVLPVIADTDFRVPTRDMLREIAISDPPTGPNGQQQRSPEDVSLLVLDLFQEIAVLFNPKHATAAVLDATVARVGKRVSTKRMRSGLRPGVRSSDSLAMRARPVQSEDNGKSAEVPADLSPATQKVSKEDSGMNDEAAVDESRSASFWRGSLADAESLAQGDFAFEVIASMTKRDP